MPVTGFTPDQPASPQGGASFTPDTSPPQASAPEFTPDQTAQPQENWVQSAAHSPAGKFVQKVGVNAQRAAVGSARDTLGAGLNIMQTPARFAAGLEDDNHEGNILTNPIHAAGRAFLNLVDINAGNHDIDEVAKVLKGFMPHTDNHLGDAIEFFGAQMAQDPTTILPFAISGAKTLAATQLAKELAAGAASVGAKIPGLDKTAQVGQAISEAYHKTIGDVAHHFLAGRPELDASLNKAGKTLRLGTEIRNATKMKDELGKPDKALLKSVEDALENVKPGEPVPEPLRQRTLQEAWRYGKAKDRADALELGYHVTPEDAAWKDAPEELLDYPHGLRKDYEFTGDVNKKIPTLPAFAAHEARYGKKTASFEYERKQHALENLEADRRKRWDIRLRMGRDMVRKRRVDQETEKLITKYDGWKGQEQVQQAVEDAKAAHIKAIANAKKTAALFRSTPEQARSGAVASMEREMKELKAKKVMDDKDVQKYHDLQAKISSVKSKKPEANAAYFADRAKKLEEQAAELEKNPPKHDDLVRDITAKHIHDLTMNLSHSHARAWKDYNLRWLSNMGKNSITGTGLPHLIGNLATFASWRGGVPVLINGARKMLPNSPGKALGLFQTGVPEATVARLKAGGGFHDFEHDFERGILTRQPGIKQALIGSNALLNRGELALRAAVLDGLDRELGPSKNALDEFKKMEIIRETVADTHNQNAFVSLLEAAGAPFASFIGATAHAAGKTAMSPSAYRLTVPLRAQRDMDKDRQDFHGLQMMNPAITTAHLMGSGSLSESHVGPIPGAIAALAGAVSGHPQFANPLNKAAEMVQDYGGPIGSQIPSLNSMPFHAPGAKPGDFAPYEALLHYLLGWYHQQQKSGKAEKYINRSALRSENL